MTAKYVYAQCHPDRLHVAKGLCRYCYNHKSYQPKQKEAQYKITAIGAQRKCSICRSWWPLEPENDGNGNPVRFWQPGDSMCYACLLARGAARMRLHRAA